MSARTASTEGPRSPGSNRLEMWSASAASSATSSTVNTVPTRASSTIRVQGVRGIEGEPYPIAAGTSPRLAGHVPPPQVLVDPGLTGEAEHPLAQDVLHDLRRAALDRVGPGTQEPLAGRAQTGRT